MNESPEHLALRLLPYNCPQVIGVLLHRFNTPEPVGVIPTPVDPSIVSTGQKNPDQEDKTKPAAVDDAFEFRTKDKRLARLIFWEIQRSYDGDKLHGLFIYLQNGLEYYRKQEGRTIPLHLMVFTPKGNLYAERVAQATREYAKIDPERFNSTGYPYFLFLNPKQLPVVGSLNDLMNDPGIRAFAAENQPKDVAIATAALATLIAASNPNSREAAEVALAAGRALNDALNDSHLRIDILTPVLLLHVKGEIMDELLPQDEALQESVRTIGDRLRAEAQAEAQLQLQARVQAQVQAQVQALVHALVQVQSQVQSQARIMLTGLILNALQQNYQFDQARLHAAREGLANSTVEKLEQVLSRLFALNLSNEEVDALLVPDLPPGPERAGNGHG